MVLQIDTIGVYADLSAYKIFLFNRFWFISYVCFISTMCIHLSSVWSFLIYLFLKIETSSFALSYIFSLFILNFKYLSLLLLLQVCIFPLPLCLAYFPFPFFSSLYLSNFLSLFPFVFPSLSLVLLIFHLAQSISAHFYVLFRFLSQFKR